MSENKRYRVFKYIDCEWYGVSDDIAEYTLATFDNHIEAEGLCDRLNEQDERIKELEQELQNLQTFKKILEFAEKDMEERADWQAYCEKEFEGL